MSLTWLMLMSAEGHFTWSYLEVEGLFHVAGFCGRGSVQCETPSGMNIIVF